LADGILGDIALGVDGTRVRAGIIGGMGARCYHVSPADERSFRAAARAHKRTDLTISTHATYSAVGLDQLDILGEDAADLRRVIVGRCDIYIDPDYHEAMAKRMAWHG